MPVLKIVTTVQVSIHKFKHFEENFKFEMYIKLLHGFFVNFCTLYRSILMYAPCILSVFYAEQ
jgi:hypothetical protein